MAARLEGVACRVALHSADLRSLPFAEGSFDVVRSGLAIHNLGVAAVADRNRAIDEAVRVLKPNGALRIADLGLTKE